MLNVNEKCKEEEKLKKEKLFKYLEMSLDNSFNYNMNVQCEIKNEKKTN